MEWITHAEDLEPDSRDLERDAKKNKEEEERIEEEMAINEPPKEGEKKKKFIWFIQKKKQLQRINRTVRREIRYARADGRDGRMEGFSRWKDGW